LGRNLFEDLFLLGVIGQQKAIPPGQLLGIPNLGNLSMLIMANFTGRHGAVVENGVYYLDATAKPAIAFLDVNNGRTTRVFDLENRPATQAPGLAISSVDGTMLYTQLDALSRDFMLVENFR